MSSYSRYKSIFNGDQNKLHGTDFSSYSVTHRSENGLQMLVSSCGPWRHVDLQGGKNVSKEHNASNFRATQYKIPTSTSSPPLQHKMIFVSNKINESWPVVHFMFCILEIGRASHLFSSSFIWSMICVGPERTKIKFARQSSEHNNCAMIFGREACTHTQKQSLHLAFTYWKLRRCLLLQNLRLN